MLAEKNIKVQLDFPEGCWTVLGDAGQLKQVCINLVINAQEAMGQGGSLSIGLSSVLERGRNTAVVRIADTGGGIPDDLISSIFTPFFTTKRHGTGLGLAIVNRIVQNHGGTLTVRNSDQGAEFKIYLPLAPEEITAMPA